MKELLPPNLAKLGLKRLTGPPEADLETIWNTPYPVIRSYMSFCFDYGLMPFAGGSRQNQKDGLGKIMSGYRDKVIDAKHSPHFFAFALDIAVGGPELQIQAAKVARRHFTRVGLYPDKGIIHVDLATDRWMEVYGGRRFWVAVDGKYKSFDLLDDAIEHIRLGVT